MTPRNLRRTEVLAKTGLSKTALYHLEKGGAFPKHTMLTPRLAVWSEADVDAWLSLSRAAPAITASAPNVTRRKTVGKRKAASGPQLNEVRQMLMDAMRLLDRLERQGVVPTVSVASCWNEPAGVSA